MTEFHYRIDDARELVLTGEPLRWWVHDWGLVPREWDVPTEREKALFAEIQRLTGERDNARRATHELGLDFQRVYHDAQCCYRCARAGQKLETPIPYLEQPEPENVR